MPAPNAPSKRVGKASAEERGEQDLDNGAGTAIALHGEDFGEREVQPNAEHQQKDADFGKPVASAWSATKPGVKGPIMTPASK